MKLILTLMVAVGLTACGAESKYMSGKDLVKGEQSNSPEAQALISAFDQDNGKIYCVPKMKDAQLGEFKTALPGLMIKQTFAAAFSGKGIEIDEKNPIRDTLRIALKQAYPCN